MTLPSVNSGVLGRLRRRMSKQAHRGFSIYIFCCALIILVLSQLSSYGPALSKKAELVRRAAYPYQATMAAGAFPRKIWQSWKIDPLDFDERDQTCARSWVNKNPGYRYEVLTDNNDMQYVETHFGPGGLDRPDIVFVYQSLSAKIIKADLLRYMVMYIEGGVYVDIDVEALKPIDRFIPDTGRFSEAEIDMIIGVEVDQPQFATHPILGSKSMSFCQWTFVCKPRLPVMLHLIEHIVNWLYDVAEQQNVSISDISLTFDDVISGTGPSAFTQAILAEMSKREKKEITWDYFHDMDESRLVGGVLVLTVEAFAAGQGHSDSGTHNSRNALVKHHYHASGWPTLHPRYKHPVYGEVEACNWEPECVKLWDFSKAAFEALPPEEQARQIAEKEAAERAFVPDQFAPPMPMDLPIQLPAQLDLPGPIPAQPVDAPVAVPIEAPVAVPIDPPVAIPVEAPAHIPADAPVAGAVEAPVAIPVDAPIAVPPMNPPVAVPIDAPAPAPLDAAVQQLPPPPPPPEQFGGEAVQLQRRHLEAEDSSPQPSLATVSSLPLWQQFWWKTKASNTAASFSLSPTVAPQRQFKRSATVASHISAHFTVTPTVSPVGNFKSLLSGFATVYSKPSAIANEA